MQGWRDASGGSLVGMRRRRRRRRRRRKIQSF